jgi:hypothetical protein
MAIACPNCKAQYDVTLFAFGRCIRCDCGAWVDLDAGHRQAANQENEFETPQRDAAIPRDTSERDRRDSN